MMVLSRVVLPTLCRPTPMKRMGRPSWGCDASGMVLGPLFWPDDMPVQVGKLFVDRSQLRSHSLR